MKHLFSFIVIALIFGFSFVSNAQESKSEINKLNKDTEHLLDSAAKHMIYFILTKNELDYTSSIEKIEQAEKMNTELEGKIKGEKGMGGKVEAEIVEENKEEIASYKNDKLKSEILDEKDKSQHIKFKGKSYQIGKKAKGHFDLFSTYLPKN